MDTFHGIPRGVNVCTAEPSADRSDILTKCYSGLPGMQYSVSRESGMRKNARRRARLKSLCFRSGDSAFFCFGEVPLVPSVCPDNAEHAVLLSLQSGPLERRICGNFGLFSPPASPFLTLFLPLRQKIGKRPGLFHGMTGGFSVNVGTFLRKCLGISPLLYAF